MGKIETKTSEVEGKNEGSHQLFSEKIEKMRFLNKEINRKVDIAEKLSIEFSEKVQELKEACHEVRKILSE